MGLRYWVSWVSVFFLIGEWPVKPRYSKKSPTGPTERTPKPEYLIVLATYLGGPLGFGPIQFLMELFIYNLTLAHVLALMFEKIRLGPTGWSLSDVQEAPGVYASCLQLAVAALATVDGWNPVPVEVGSLSHHLITRFYTS